MRKTYFSVEREIPISPQARRFDRPRSHANARLARAAPAGSPLSTVDLLEQVDVKIALSKQLLELGVLRLQRLQALHVGWLQAPEVLTPAVDRLLANPVLLGRLGHRGPVGLAQNRDHLLVGASALSHRLFVVEEPSSQKSLGRNSRAGHWNVKIQRTTDVVWIFRNEAAIARLVGVLLLEQHDEWQLQRHYLQLEGLQALGDNQPARLFAIMS